MPPIFQSLRCIAVTFSSDAIIASLSSGAEQWTGYTSRELVGRPVTYLMADKSAYEFQEILKAAADWGTWEGELIIVNRSGVQLTTEGVISTLSGYSHLGFLMVVSMGAQVAPRETGLDVLSEVGQKLRMISHDMNNPLAVTMGFLQLALLNDQCTGKIRSDMEKLHSELGRLVSSVERLHQYARSLQDASSETAIKSLAG